MHAVRHSDQGLSDLIQTQLDPGPIRLSLEELMLGFELSTFGQGNIKLALGDGR